MAPRIVSLCLALVIVVATFLPGNAQDTITLMYDDPASGLQRYGTVTPGLPFDVVVYMEADLQSCAAEFVMTELTVVVPGVFKLSTTKVNNTPLDLGDNDVGEYIMAFNGCVPAGPVEIVRIQYGDFGGLTPEDVMLQLRGIQPGDSYPSSFEGRIGYIDPTDGKNVLTRIPWSEFGMPDDPELEGGIVLNPTMDPVDTEIGSVGALKSNF